MALWIGAGMLLAGCGVDHAPGDVLFIVRGSGAAHTDTFDLQGGTYRIEERSQPMSCIKSIDIVGSDGVTAATLTPSRPAPTGPAAVGEDPDFSGLDVSLSGGAYGAVGNAPATCLWVVQVKVPDPG